MLIKTWVFAELGERMSSWETGDVFVTQPRQLFEHLFLILWSSRTLEVSALVWPDALSGGAPLSLLPSS